MNYSSSCWKNKGSSSGWTYSGKGFPFTKFYDDCYHIPINGVTHIVPSKSRLEALQNEIAESLSEFKKSLRQHASRPPSDQYVEDVRIALGQLKIPAITEMTSDDILKCLVNPEDCAKVEIDNELRECITKFLEGFRSSLGENLPACEVEIGLLKFLSARLPRMVYFKSFDKLADEVTIVNLMSSQSWNRAFLNLTKLAGLKVQSLMKIKNEKQWQAYVEQASGQRTKLLRKARDLEPLEIEFRLHGNRLMVFVKDSTAAGDAPAAEFGKREFQWFLGFFINLGWLRKRNSRTLCCS